MKYNIYGLVSPIDGQIVYVGCTIHSIEHRLNQHYWHLNEVIKGERSTNKRFEYLKSILPLKVSTVLLKSIDDSIPNTLSDKFWESYYIEKYRKINPNLLNETDGGKGNNTHKYKTDKQIKSIGNKISNALKGKSKPKGFAEHLSKIRKGLGNPGAKKFKEPIYAYNVVTKLLVKTPFNYGFEINKFLRRDNAWSNVSKQINKINCKKGAKTKYTTCNGFSWLTYEYAKEFMK